MEKPDVLENQTVDRNLGCRLFLRPGSRRGVRHHREKRIVVPQETAVLCHPSAGRSARCKDSCQAIGSTANRLPLHLQTAGASRNAEGSTAGQAHDCKRSRWTPAKFRDGEEELRVEPAANGS